MSETDCVFCRIITGEEPAQFVDDEPRGGGAVNKIVLMSCANAALDHNKPARIARGEDR